MSATAENVVTQFNVDRNIGTLGINRATDTAYGRFEPSPGTRVDWSGEITYKSDGRWFASVSNKFGKLDLTQSILTDDQRAALNEYLEARQHDPDAKPPKVIAGRGVLVRYDTGERVNAVAFFTRSKVLSVIVDRPVELNDYDPIADALK